jgi:IrrE N-terminal-like domain
MEEIERLAEAFLATVPSYVWDRDTLPVPIEDIADTHAGLLVRDVEDLGVAPGAPQLEEGQALSGLRRPTLGEIWVNGDEARQWPPRRRFTIAHELGRWCLHRDVERNEFCRASAIEPVAPELRPPLPPAEEQANSFAAALLMPSRLIEERYADCNGDFITLCDTFGASGAAMGRRRYLKSMAGPPSWYPTTRYSGVAPAKRSVVAS